MNKSAWWAWAIRNSVCVICWTTLAIVFNKWWICLFSMLFLCSLQNETVKNIIEFAINAASIVNMQIATMKH